MLIFRWKPAAGFDMDILKEMCKCDCGVLKRNTTLPEEINWYRLHSIGAFWPASVCSTHIGPSCVQEQ